MIAKYRLVRDDFFVDDYHVHCYDYNHTRIYSYNAGLMKCLAFIAKLEQIINSKDEIHHYLNAQEMIDEAHKSFATLGDLRVR